MTNLVNYLLIIFLIFLITVIILVLTIIYYCMKLQDSKTEELRRSFRQMEVVPGHSIGRAGRQANRNTVHAVNNEYLSQPTQRAPQRHSLDSSLFHDYNLPVMRFYTAEELLHYPFERHQRELSALIAAAEQNSSVRSATDLRAQHSYHSDHRALPPPSVSAELSRRLSVGSSYRRHRPSPENFSSQPDIFLRPPPTVSQSPLKTAQSSESDLCVIPEETLSHGSSSASEDPQNASKSERTAPPSYEQTIATDFVTIPL